MNCPGAAARRSSIAGSPASINSVCSIITTASAPRGITPPVAMVVAVPGATSSVGAWPQAITSALSASCFGAASLAPAVSAARSAKPSTLERSNGGASIGADHVMRQHAAERGRKRHASRRQAATDRDARSKRALRLLGRHHFEELLLARGRAHARQQIALGRRAVSASRSWPRPYRRPGRRRNSLRCRPAPGPSRRRAPAPDSGRYPAASGSTCRRRAAHRDDFGEADGRGDLARQRQRRRPAPRSRGRRRAAASRRRPSVSQTASAASSRPGSSSTGRVPAKPKRRGLAGRQADAVHGKPAGARKRARRCCRCVRCRCRR